MSPDVPTVKVRVRSDFKLQIGLFVIDILSQILLTLLTLIS